MERRQAPIRCRDQQTKKVMCRLMPRGSAATEEAGSTNDGTGEDWPRIGSAVPLLRDGGEARRVQFVADAVEPLEARDGLSQFGRLSPGVPGSLVGESVGDR